MGTLKYFSRSFILSCFSRIDFVMISPKIVDLLLRQVYLDSVVIDGHCQHVKNDHISLLLDFHALNCDDKDYRDQQGST